MFKTILNEVADDLGIDRKIVKEIGSSMTALVAQGIMTGVGVRVKGLGIFKTKPGRELAIRKSAVLNTLTSFTRCCEPNTTVLRNKEFSAFGLTTTQHELVLRGVKCEVVKEDCPVLLSFPALYGLGMKLDWLKDNDDLSIIFAKKYFNLTPEKLIQVFDERYKKGSIFVIVNRENLSDLNELINLSKNENSS